MEQSNFMRKLPDWLQREEALCCLEKAISIYKWILTHCAVYSANETNDNVFKAKSSSPRGSFTES